MTKGPKEDRIGWVFGMLTIIGNAAPSGKAARYLCRCECGKEKVILYNNMRRGGSTNCGCQRTKALIASTTSHGLSHTPFYNVWSGMRQRCRDKNHISYYRYGGIGIKSCERWESFENFYADMFETYKPGLTLDRIDNKGDYCPENCRWVDWIEQAKTKSNSTMLDFDGESISLPTLARRFGISQKTLRRRILHGMTPKEAVTTPVRNAGARSVSKLKT